MVAFVGFGVDRDEDRGEVEGVLRDGSGVEKSFGSKIGLTSVIGSRQAQVALETK